MFNKEILKLYFICGTTTCNNKNLEQVVEEALRGGITSFQFREKGDGALVGFQKEELARKIQNLCRLYQVPFIINDDIELALEIDADGVHVGQGDGNIEKIRKLLPDKIIGLSVGNEEEQRRSKLEFVDYIGVGPVHSTISKNEKQAFEIDRFLFSNEVLRIIHLDEDDEPDTEYKISTKELKEIRENR